MNCVLQCGLAHISTTAPYLLICLHGRYINILVLKISFGLGRGHIVPISKPENKKGAWNVHFKFQCRPVVDSQDVRCGKSVILQILFPVCRYFICNNRYSNSCLHVFMKLSAWHNCSGPAQVMWSMLASPWLLSWCATTPVTCAGTGEWHWVRLGLARTCVWLEPGEHTSSAWSTLQV